MQHMVLFKILLEKTEILGNMRSLDNEYRQCHEKTSYVSNYAFITSLHEWVDRRQTHQLEKLLCV